MVTVSIRRPARAGLTSRSEPKLPNFNLEHRACAKVEQDSHFCGRADRFQFQQRGDVLIVRGTVPSFYLKQVLQTVLKDLDGVRRIDNQVDVICCDGLSSVRGDE